MADLVFNIAKGKFAYYAGLPAAADALIAVPIETTGLEADETLKDYDTLSALLAGTSNEQTSNMTRKTLASVTVTVDDTPGANWVNVDAADPVWTAATGNAISALVICYDPDTGTGTTLACLRRTPRSDGAACRHHQLAACSCGEGCDGRHPGRSTAALQPLSRGAGAVGLL